MLERVVPRFKEKYAIALEDPQYSFEKLEADVVEIFENFEDDEQLVSELMRKECIESIKRAKKRGTDTGRKDDVPTPLLKRLTDYFENSYLVPFLFDNPIIVATKSKPEEVAKQFFCKYLNIPRDSSDFAQGGPLYKLVRRYQTLAARKVNGEFKYVFNNKRLERTHNPKYHEYIYWDDKTKVLYYTIVTKSGETITYEIGRSGTKFYEIPSVIQQKESLARELGIVIYNTETLQSFWERQPELWGLDKSLFA